MGARLFSWRIITGLFLVAATGILPLRAVAASSPLYTARWTAGLGGWKSLGDSGWKVAGGMAVYGNHTGAADLAATYRLGHLRDFAVEAAIERIGGPGASRFYSEPGYGVFVRGSGTRGANVGGGFFPGDPDGNGYYPQSALDWGGNVLRGDTVALHDGFNTFRLEVHSNQYAVFENGVLTTQATVKGFRGDQVGVFSRQYRIRVRSFRVLALSPRSASGGPPASLLAGLAALNLHGTDVPTGFGRVYGEYFTNKEVAVQRNVAVESLRQSGRLLSYEVEYGRFLDRKHPEKGENMVSAVVAAFRSPEGARADYDRLAGTYGSAWNRLPSPGKYGVQDFLASDDWASSGVQFRTDDLLFVRGTHRISLRFVSVRGSVPDTQPMLWLDTTARDMDARLKAAGS